ncbi:MAG TPA: glycine zipper 2TM domain-containing protein [Rhodanobacteraceae bacterium]
MKLRDSLAAMVLATALVGAGTMTTARAADRDYVEKCGNCGTVVGVEQVKHKDSHIGAGTAIGAVAGGVLGSTIGKGNGRTAATVGGAVAGGAIGHEVEKNNRPSDYSWRFSVEMDNGRQVTVMQADNPDIQSGDRVRVFNGRLERF